jgi:hypothetical protein
MRVILCMSQGADCLGKYVGDAERTLRLLFEDVSQPVSPPTRRLVGLPLPALGMSNSHVTLGHVTLNAAFTQLGTQHVGCCPALARPGVAPPPSSSWMSWMRWPLPAQ